MIELGRYVEIYTEPTYGSEYFDEDDVYTSDYVSGISKVNGEIVYQLNQQDEDCWWVEDELEELSDRRWDNNPTFELDDEVIESDDPQIAKRITGIFLACGDFVYDLNDYGQYVDEGELTLYRKNGDALVNYTLF